MKIAKLTKLFVLGLPIILSSCGGSSDPYSKVNTALNKQYESFALKVETTYGQLKLESVYTFTLSNDNYSVSYVEQQYNEFSLDDNADQKTIVSGTKTVAASEISFKKFAVKKSTYSEIEYDEEAGTFKGNVADSKTLLDSNDAVSNFVVTMSFTDSLTSLSYSYSSNNCQTVATYSNFR